MFENWFFMTLGAAVVSAAVFWVAFFTMPVWVPVVWLVRWAF